jgi:outer membrane lipoprotein LolB
VRSLRPLLPILFIWILGVLVGCANRAGTPQPDLGAHWQGRLSIQVDSTPSQSLTALFDLQGNAQAGSLSLASPLGTTMANLQWTAQSARLQANGESREFASLDALVRHVIGTDLPVDNLFSWLEGIPAPAMGWQADLHDLGNGRLSAQRSAPYTPAALKIILDR